MDATTTRRVTSVALPVVAVAVLTAVLSLADADLTVAALCFVPVVVGSALMGAFPGGVGVLAAFLATNYFFTPPRNSFGIDKTQDLVALVAFGVAAGVVSATVARVNLLRHRAIAQEHEARTRLELTNRLAREARTARDEAEVEQARAGFLAAMTHNLRTPLASISAAASVLLDPGAGLDRRKQVELLETVRGEADRLDRLVTKVLLLGRIQSGAVHPEPEPVEVEELVQAAARRMRLLGLGRVQLSRNEDLPSVMVDQALIEVALVNVLENALRYSSPETMVEVELTRAQDCVRVSVADHGPGVPAGDRERVFERFARGAEAHDAVGAGIGLAITREFVQAHGGRCWLQQTPGGGATVVMTLPVASASP